MEKNEEYCEIDQNIIDFGHAVINNEGKYISKKFKDELICGINAIDDIVRFAKKTSDFSGEDKSVEKEHENILNEEYEKVLFTPEIKKYEYFTFDRKKGIQIRKDKALAVAVEKSNHNFGRFVFCFFVLLYLILNIITIVKVLMDF